MCRMHGGGAPQVRRAAQRRLVIAEVLRLLAKDQERRRRDVAAVAPFQGRYERLAGLLEGRHPCPRSTKDARELLRKFGGSVYEAFAV